MPYFKYNDKKVYFNTYGKKGPYLLLLHGNSVASSMFKKEIKRYYEKHFKVFVFDYPGHGKSQKLDALPQDFWFENAKVAIALFERLKVERAYVIGTSGGALVGLNLSLERPDLVIKTICDSFIGEQIPVEMAEKIKQARLSEKNGEMGLAWFMLHGFNWEKVVDMDTQMLLQAAKTGQKLYHKDLSEIKVPVLLTGSKTDETVPGMEALINNLKKKSSNYQSYIFDTGSHMTMLTKNYDFARLAKDFFSR
ncbi:MAG: alpha/beta hydrolase [bacterium]